MLPTLGIHFHVELTTIARIEKQETRFIKRAAWLKKDELGTELETTKTHSIKRGTLLQVLERCSLELKSYFQNITGSADVH